MTTTNANNLAFRVWDHSVRLLIAREVQPNVNQGQGNP